MKKCIICKIDKTKEEFCKNKLHKDGLQKYCKVCKNAYAKQYYLINKEKIKQNTKQYRLANKEGLRQYDKQYYLTHLAERKQWRYMSRYGLSTQQVLQMYNELREICPLCKGHMILGGNNENSVHIDHNHSTGTVRGLTCSNCNIMLGYAKEDVSTLQRAIDYLKKHSS